MNPDDMTDAEWDAMVEDAFFELDMMRAEMRLEEVGGNEVSR